MRPASGRPAARISAGLALALLAAVAAPGARAIEPIPEADLTGLEPAVVERLTAARRALVQVLASPGAAEVERGRLYGETGKVFHAHHAFGIAEACYRNAAELLPEEREWPYLLGFLYQDSGRFEAAREAYGRVLALAPGDRFATFRLAQVDLALGDLDRAEPRAREVADAEGLAAAARELLGRVAAAREDWAAAVRHYEAVLALEPAADRVRVPLGLAYRNLGELERAREALAAAGETKVTVSDPILREIGSLTASSEMYLTTAAQALKAERYDLAEEAYRGALALNPENVRAHVNLAELLARRGALGEAEASARRALELDPESFFAWFNLASIAEAAGRHAEALGFWEKAVERDPEHVRANFRFGGALLRAGDYARAAERLRAAVERAPGFVQARYLEALAQLALGDRAAARTALEEAVEIAPERLELTGSLARLLATGEPPSAADGERALALARALHERRRGADDLETLAMALAAAGRFEEAVTAQLAVIEAARELGDEALLRHLRHNLERYRGGLPSDRPWREGGI